MKEKWIATKEKEPDVGSEVITYHQLNRVDIMRFDGERFLFLNSSPLGLDMKPISTWESWYPKKVITHWMSKPEGPNAQLRDAAPAQPPQERLPND